MTCVSSKIDRKTRIYDFEASLDRKQDRQKDKKIDRNMTLIESKIDGKTRIYDFEVRQIERQEYMTLKQEDKNGVGEDAYYH